MRCRVSGGGRTCWSVRVLKSIYEFAVYLKILETLRVGPDQTTKK